MFRRNYETRDGFFLKKERFELPDDMTTLSAEDKRAITICNLFLNHKFTLFMIVRLLDEEYSKIIRALLAYDIVYDRRLLRGRGPEGIERRHEPLNLVRESTRPSDA